MFDKTISFSENVQMYLVTILRLREEGSPVSLPDLARELSISAAAVNEMSRKLEDQGLLGYQPYSGVSLTPEGEKVAEIILRKHRLWEVFLVNTLGYDYRTAHETACHLEHATPPHLADRLESYLEKPLVNPQGKPIPYPGGKVEFANEIALALLSPGEEAAVHHLRGPDTLNDFLQKNHIKPGSRLRVLASGEESLLVGVDGSQTVISREIAAEIFVHPLSDGVADEGSTGGMQ